MDTAHSKTSCPVYLHPAAARNPATVQRIQQATGHVVVLSAGRPTLKHATQNTADFEPWGGDAA